MDEREQLRGQRNEIGELPPYFRLVSGELRPRLRGYGERNAVSPVAIARRGPWGGGVFWLSFAALWISIGWAMRADFGSGAWLLFPFTAFGLLVGYCGLVVLLNRTVFQVTAKTLAVTHKPIPWPGVRVPNHRARAFAVVRRRHTTQERRTYWTFSVYVRCDDGGGDVKLWQAGDEAEAVFVAKAFAQQLGLEVEDHD